LKLLAAELARNPIPSRTFLVFCSLTPQQSWRGLRSPEFKGKKQPSPLKEPGCKNVLLTGVGSSNSPFHKTVQRNEKFN